MPRDNPQVETEPSPPAQSPVAGPAPTTGTNLPAVRDPMAVPLADCYEKVQVLVGPEHKQMWAYASHLCRHSTVLGEKCKKMYDNGQLMKVYLMDHDVDAVATFLHYVNTGYSFKAEILQEVVISMPSPSEFVKQKWLHLARCYILGTALGANMFKNKIMDYMYEYLNAEHYHHVDLNIDIGIISLVWSRTPPKSPLRLWVLDRMVNDGHYNKSFLEGLSVDDTGAFEFLKDLALAGPLPDAYVMAGGARGLAFRDKCAYHEHADLPEGYSCIMTTLKD